jgi:hypothetical protein
VSVTYTKPNEYSDVAFSPYDRERVLKQFTEYFTGLDKKLPSGEQLKVEILDIDLAGRMVPRHGGVDDIRVMNGGADWPHIKLRYTLTENGQTVRSGEENLSNMMYQQRYNRYADGDPLRYEKQMLDDWFDKAIVPKVAAR